MRSVPNLIYAMEQFEKLLIQLGKKAKVCSQPAVTCAMMMLILPQQENLMESFKRSLARDFRIDLEAVENVLNEEEEELEEGSGEEGDADAADSDAQPPAPKKRKS